MNETALNNQGRERGREGDRGKEIEGREGMGDMNCMLSNMSSSLLSSSKGWSFMEACEASAILCADVLGSADEQAETLAGKHEDYMLIIADEGCFDKETEILTNNGWKYFENLTNSDLVLSMDKVTHNAFYEKPVALIKYKHNGEMLKYKSRTADFCITEDHNMYYRTSYKP
jgi:hypothetical protein